MFDIIFKENFATMAVHYDVKICLVETYDNNDDKQQYKQNPQKQDKKPALKSKRELKSKRLFRKVFDEWRKKYYPQRYPAYDGMANAYTARELPFENTVSNK